MHRNDRLAALLGISLLGAFLLMAIVLNVRSPDPPDDLRRALSTPVSIPQGMVTVSIDIGAALERAGRDWGDGFEFDIHASEVVARSEEVRIARNGPPAVLGGTARQVWYRGYEESVVAVTFEDTWPDPFDRRTEGQFPSVLDADGYEVVLGGGSSGCTKDAQGFTHPGTTTIEVVVEPDEVGVLTYVLGPAHLSDPC